MSHNSFLAARENYSEHKSDPRQVFVTPAVALAPLSGYDVTDSMWVSVGLTDFRSIRYPPAVLSHIMNIVRLFDQIVPTYSHKT